MPGTLPSPDHPARRVADPGSWMMNDKNVQRLWRDEGLRVPATRWRKRLGSSTAPRIPTADCAKQGAAVDFQFDATTDGRSIKIGWNRTGDLPLFRRSCGLHRCVSTGETGSGMSNRAGWSTQPAGLAPFWPHGLATGAATSGLSADRWGFPDCALPRPARPPGVATHCNSCALWRRSHRTDA